MQANAPCPVDVKWLSTEALALDRPGATPRRPLIAGGAGLVGSNLLVLLANCPSCERVRVLDLGPPRKAVIADILDKVEFIQFRLGVDDDSRLREALEGVDCVYSLVTPHIQIGTVEEFKLTNVRGVDQLARACKESGVGRLVHLASSAVVNHYISHDNSKEADEPPPLESYQSPYDRTKRRGEEIALQANAQDGLRSCSIRCSGIFLSPWDFAWKNMWPLIPGLPVILQPDGYRIDFIDGRDVARALVMAAQGLEERPELVAGEAFYVTKGAALMPGDVSRATADILNYRHVTLPEFVVRIVMVMCAIVHFIKQMLRMRVPGVSMYMFMSMMFIPQTFDNSKALDVLGFKPKVAMDDSIRRIVDLYRLERLTPSVQETHRAFWSRTLSMVFVVAAGTVVLT